MLAAASLWIAPVGPPPAVSSTPAPVAHGAPGAPTASATPGPAAPVEVEDTAVGPGGRGSRTPEGSHRTHLLSRGVAGFADVAAWPEGVVTWATNVPRRYRWSVQQGVRAWNRTVDGVRFERKRWTEADLWIGVGDTGGAAALATVGYDKHAQSTITLTRTRLPSWKEKQLYGRVVTHELGHVLGLEHTRGRSCGVMEATLDAACSPEPQAERFACRWVGPQVGEAVAKRYGGQFRAGPRTCRLRPGSRS